jgi:predicted DNA-binding transcriptional regulator AlpA
MPTAIKRNLEPLLDEHEVAEILRRPVKTLRCDRSLGKGPPYLKLGRSVRYRPADIREYMTEGLSAWNQKQERA